MQSLPFLPPTGPGLPAARAATLLEAINDLTGAIHQLLGALGVSEATSAANAKPATPWLAEEAAIVAEATEDWDLPWESMSVRELRALVRDLPIDRTTLPAPIELMRRHELLEALKQIQALPW